MSHLAALAIVVPLLSAPLCVIAQKPICARVIATLACLASFVIACGLHQQVLETGPLAYHVGGWEPPWGIELRADAMTVLLLLITSGIATVVIIAGIGDNSHGIAPGRDALFYAAYLLCLCGLLGMTLTGDAFNVFVFLEISSLSTYTLIALGRGRRAVRAALTYLMMGTVGATFILLGIGLMYQLTGSLNMEDLSRLLPKATHSRTLLMSFAFLMVGLGLKVAVFPLHQWLPNAYAHAPSATSSFVAGTGTKVIYYLMIRFVFTVYGATLAFGTLGLQIVLLPLSIVAMFAGSLAAIFQKDLKRLLAYSSVAQLGYLTLALSLGTAEGVQAGLLHTLNHAVMKAGLFLVAAAILARVGSTRIADLRGLGRKMPLTMAALVVGGLGLIGVPGTAGFISKWYLVLAALDAEHTWVAGLVLLSSLLAVVYVWRLVEVIYFQKPSRGEQEHASDSRAKAGASEAEATAHASDSKVEARDSNEGPDWESPRTLIPAWTLMLASIYFGFFTEFGIDLSSKAAQRLLLPPSEQVATTVLTGRELLAPFEHPSPEPLGAQP